MGRGRDWVYIGFIFGYCYNLLGSYRVKEASQEKYLHLAKKRDNLRMILIPLHDPNTHSYWGH